MSKKIVFPTMKTLLLVENLLRENSFDLFSRAEIIRRLGGRINNKNLNTILAYLEADNKILDGTKGIQWIYSGNKNIPKLLKEGLIM